MIRILYLLATLGTGLALLSYLHTHDLLLALRIGTASLAVCLGCWSMAVLHLYRHQRPRRDQRLHARHHRIRARQFGEDGCTIHPVLFGIAAIIGFHVLFALLVFIATAVLGAGEVNW